MEDLLTNFSLTQIAVFVVILAVAIKEFVNFVDWAVDRIHKATDKDYQSKEEQKALKSEIAGLEKFYAEKEKVDKGFEEIHQSIESINKRIDMLIESDRNDIKSYITEKHHYYVHNQKWIDDYTMECIENRYDIYKSEHGNSFIAKFMEDLRKLPSQPV